jgi:hypothetical protein
MKTNGLRTAARIGLGGALVFTGISHLTFARRGFQAQVPEWVPADVDTTVLLSGVAEDRWACGSRVFRRGVSRKPVAVAKSPQLTRPGYRYQETRSTSVPDPAHPDRAVVDAG